MDRLSVPTRRSLELLEAHIAHIPFENFDVLLGRPVRLDLEGLQSKLVMSRRGGYCFEHATLFAAVLERLDEPPASGQSGGSPSSALLRGAASTAVDDPNKLSK